MRFIHLLSRNPAFKESFKDFGDNGSVNDHEAGNKEKNRHRRELYVTTTSPPENGERRSDNGRLLKWLLRIITITMNKCYDALQSRRITQNNK